MTEKRFEAICELGKRPSLVDNSAKWVKNNGVEITVRRTFVGDYDISSSDSDCIYFANLLNSLHEENKQLKKKLDFFNELNKPYGDLIKENQQLKCINKQLEERLGRSLALDMEECE